MADVLPSIPGYEIRRVLGSGSTATVYDAREKNLGRRVALKVFDEEKLGKEEFDALSRCIGVESPHITRVHRAGLEGGHAFIEMELISGRSLLGWIRSKGRLAPQEAITILRGVLDGLAALHEADLVHRDVKPANIFIEETERGPVPKLGDFGLLRSEEGPPTMPRGTPGYVPPETGLTSYPRPPSHEVDLYGAGAVLFTCLTGREPDRYWSLHLRGVPPVLQRVIRRALSEDPAKRFATVREMKESLAAWKERRPALIRAGVVGGAALVLLGLAMAMAARERIGDLLSPRGPGGDPTTASTGAEALPAGGGSAAPGVVIKRPTKEESYITPNPFLFLAGTAMSPRGVRRVTWHNAANESSGIATGTDVWSVTISMVSGVNPIVVRAHDGSGIAGASSLRIYNGGAWSCGQNLWGQLGSPVKKGRSRVAHVEGLGEISEVDAGAHHSLAVLGSGKVMAWGRNSDGQLGDGSLTDSPRPVEVKDLEGVSRVSAGDAHSLALRRDGTLMAWGLNDRGQLGDGTLINRPKPVRVLGLSGVTAVAAGSRHSVALLEDGTVRAWGAVLAEREVNSKGVPGLGAMVEIPDREDPSGILHGVKAISSNADHTIALLEDGTLRSWGANHLGQLGNGTMAGHVLIPVTVADNDSPDGILRNVAFITSGGEHSMALLNDGTVRAWGANDKGQLGDGSTRASPYPVRVIDAAAPGGILEDVVRIATGPRAKHSIALLADGSVRSWGANESGQLGDGTTGDRHSPATVRDFIDPAGFLLYIKGAAVGAAHTIVYK